MTDLTLDGAAYHLPAQGCTIDEDIPPTLHPPPSKMQKRNSEAARFLALFYALPERTPEPTTTTSASTEKSASPEIQPDGPQSDARLPVSNPVFTPTTARPTPTSLESYRRS
ncbi:hypothetical protein LTR12_001795 [Friedmanniomyces endolithicus]|nr:hypothetical protein LTR74_007113 [Friedmanniomyces endolithicus]KAK1823839.1 hypothetical protein LTR12_001795 [Friedmanniomyces endolithicus]